MLKASRNEFPLSACLLLISCLAAIALFPHVACAAWNKEVDVIISVDWEGADLTYENLAAIEAFRAEFPQIPMVQFLNAAYYTANPAARADITNRIRRGIKSCDEIGLHVHGWKDLFEAAFTANGRSASRYLNAPGFWGPTASPEGDGREGHDVPIKTYAIDELQDVIRFSIKTLNENGFTGPFKSFRAGGWMADEKVLTAIAREGFEIDSSAIAPYFLRARIGHTPLFAYVNELWGPESAHPTTDITRPYRISSDLVEVPGALFADYVTDNQLTPVLEHMASAATNAQTRPILHLSFHEETAARYLYVLRSMLKRLQTDYTEQMGFKFYFRTLSDDQSCSH